MKKFTGLDINKTAQRMANVSSYLCCCLLMGGALIVTISVTMSWASDLVR
ncbi:unnamed protein product [Fructobacillus fructosus]|nr:unnamed protein product [Fructobacillus fructosus]CAK1236119.1 unnamed protein product [Fructobacillus fructosus]CAK1237399.1 unnamed protein product [Fructobacillus fructosus]